MQIEPLKIPAFMRKKSFAKKNKESSDFYKPSAEPSQPAPIVRETPKANRPLSYSRPASPALPIPPVPCGGPIGQA